MSYSASLTHPLPIPQQWYFALPTNNIHSSHTVRSSSMFDSAECDKLEAKVDWTIETSRSVDGRPGLMVSVSLKFIQPRIPTCLGSLGENYNVILIVCMTSGTLCGPYIPTTMLSLSKQPIKSANPSRGTTIPRASLKTRQLFTNLRTTIIE